MQVSSELFSAHVERSGGVARLRLSGRFDSGPVPELEWLIDETHSFDIVVDLGEVTSMNGAGWLAVMDVEHRARDRGKRVRLVNTPESIRRIFELTATEHLLSESVDA
jgi:anti-anti-sigma factor